MSNSRKIIAVVLCMSVLLISYLHYSHVAAIESLHDLYRALYYVPVVLSALLFGVRGAVFLYLLVLVSYFPYLLESWTSSPLFEADRLLHLSLQGILGVLAGILVDRDKRRSKQLEKERYLAGLGQVSSTIAHDLKNPLVTIEGFARRLQKGKGDPATAVQTIIDSTEIMKNIVYDVLDFAKPISLELNKQNVTNVIRKACELCSGKAEQRKVTVSVDVPDSSLDLHIDGLRMQRALVNLLSNAIEASGEGQKVTVSVSAKEDLLSITINDNGAGMDRETLENLFIPFFTKKSAGTGLGMPIAKKIIEGHKGNIYIKSRPGEGTKITITLPVERI